MWALAAAGSLSLIAGHTLRIERDFRHRADKPISLNLLASKGDQVIPETDYFNQLVAILKEEYVEDVNDELKLATGGVRGMIASLADIHSLYYDKEDMKIFLDTMRGNYHGIGVDLAFQYPPKSGNSADEEGDMTQIPRVVVTRIVPGGPADQAGIKQGDWVETIDGAWVMNSQLIEKVRMTQQKVEKKEWPSTKLDELRKEIREKTAKSIPPMRAWKKLQTGDSGTTEIVVMRGPNAFKKSMERRVMTQQIAAGTVRPTFIPQSEKDFTKAIGAGPVTLDLRGLSHGDFATMQRYLASLAKPGKYGSLLRSKKAALPVSVQGSGNFSKLKVLVDGQTRGVPAIFAIILKKAGHAVEGSLPKSPVATELKFMPDSSGYTLNIGTYWEAGK